MSLKAWGVVCLGVFAASCFAYAVLLELERRGMVSVERDPATGAILGAGPVDSGDASESHFQVDGCNCQSCLYRRERESQS